ncbi:MULTISPECIES: hypothetical protein [unclassified Streptomyces]|uniref:hypothetical protein n=1 Tax=unclassified Streptomyces TaxID=2593676 RepID=UPI00131AEFE6|nr:MULTISPECIES: hypothetical protein [unclassified Streptomyces]
MSTQHPTPPALIRIPVRIVVLVAVLPVRMAWDALTVTARLLDRTLLRPTGRALAVAGAWLGRALFVWPWAGLWRYVVVPVARYGIAVPAAWLYRTLLRPAGRGLLRGLTAVGEGLGRFLPRLGRALAAGAGRLGRGLAWLFRAVFVWPWAGLWRYVVVPVARYGIAVPAAWLYRRALSPLGTGCLFLLEKLLFVPLAALFRYVLLPLLRYGVAVPAVRLDRYVLTPLGRGLGRFFRRAGRGLGWFLPRLGRALFVWPWAGLWRYVVVPVARYGVAVPAGWLWTRVLVPVGREVRDALALCWRVAGFVSRAVGRGLKWLAWNLLGRPLVRVWWGLRWCGRNLVARPFARVRASVVRPVGRWVRDAVSAPARQAAVEAGRAAKEALASARAVVREARRDAWRALVGSARPVEPREPEAARARTLGSTTNVSGAVPAPEISLRKRG